ncbi:hypothetical protein ACOZB2_32840 [Pantoea endophytica]
MSLEDARCKIEAYAQIINRVAPFCDDLEDSI